MSLSCLSKLGRRSFRILIVSDKSNTSRINQEFQVELKILSKEISLVDRDSDLELSRGTKLGASRTQRSILSVMAFTLTTDQQKLFSR